MKSTVTNYLGIKDSKLFFKKITDLLPKSISHIDLWHYTMNRKSGWGQYQRELHLKIDGKEVLIKHNTTDSTEWDEYHSLEYGSRPFDNFVKRVVIDTIERNIDKIEDAISSEED